MFPSTRPPSHLPEYEQKSYSQQKSLNNIHGSGRNNSKNQNDPYLTLFPVSPGQKRSPTAFPDEEFIKDPKNSSNHFFPSQNEQSQHTRRVSFSTQDDVRDFIDEKINVDLRYDDLDFIETAYIVLDAMDKTYLLDDDNDDSTRSSCSQHNQQILGENSTWNWLDRLCCSGEWNLFHGSTNLDPSSPDTNNNTTTKNYNNDIDHGQEFLLTKELLDSFLEALQFRVHRMTTFPEHDENRATQIARKMQTIISKFGYPQLEDHHAISSSNSELISNVTDSKDSAAANTPANEKVRSSQLRIKSSTDHRDENNSNNDDYDTINRDKEEDTSHTKDCDVAMYYPHYGEKHKHSKSETVVNQIILQKPIHNHDNIPSRSRKGIKANRKYNNYNENIVNGNDNENAVSLQSSVKSKVTQEQMNLSHNKTNRKYNNYNENTGNGNDNENAVSLQSSIKSKVTQEQMNLSQNDHISHHPLQMNERDNFTTIHHNPEKRIHNAAKQSQRSQEQLSPQFEEQFIETGHDTRFDTNCFNDYDLVLEPLDIIDYNNETTNDFNLDRQLTAISDSSRNSHTELILEPIERRIDTNAEIKSKKQYGNGMLVLQPLGFPQKRVPGIPNHNSPVIDFVSKDKFSSSDTSEMCQIRREHIMKEIIKIKNIQGSTNNIHVKRDCDIQVKELKMKLLKLTGTIIELEKSQKAIHYR